MPTARFFTPASDARIAGAEAELGHRFPSWLRQLYRTSDGILSADGGGPYLYSLKKSDSFPYDLVAWNQFHRDLWLSNLDDCKRSRPEIDWDRLDPHQLLIIGSDDGTEWAVRLDGDAEILDYDVRNPADREVVGADLIEACVRRERRKHEVVENLWRGRAPYRDQSDTSPPTCDVDQLFDAFIALHRPADFPPGARIGLGGSLDRATSQRPGEAGKLFIFSLGLEDEIRIATADGNLPFIMRLNAWPFGRTFSVTVHTLGDAMWRILATIPALQLPWVDVQRPCPDESALARIWQEGPGVPLPDLTAMADALCVRDDRRRVEPNDLG